MTSLDWTIAGSLFVILVAVLGLAIGSFLNVVAYRVPLGLSVVRPASACPGCGVTIEPRDNVPVLSWLVLKGKCRNCAEPISARYIVVEALTAVLFLAVAITFLPAALGAPTLNSVVSAVLVLIAFLYLAAISVVLTAIDIDVHRLPDRVVLPSYLVGAALLGSAALIGGDLEPFARSLAGAGILFAFYLALALAKPRGMGMGDVKLAGVLGLFLGQLGWAELVVGAAAAFVLGGLFGVALLMMKRAGRGTGIPFGPWMFAGAWVGIFFGAPISHAYLAATGLS
jgi:leader peptidase (prepilin peptidase) / N-methyltransferase